MEIKENINLFAVLCILMIKGTCCTLANNNDERLVQLNGCICPGQEVTYECTVCGGDSTVWNGSLFNCAGNDITLRHSQFESGSAAGECNNGAVVARSTEITTAASGSLCYISQLSFIASSDQNNKTVRCLHVTGINSATVGSQSVILITEPLPPPNNIHLSAIHPTHLTFNWNYDTIDISGINTDSCFSLVYRIFTQNCGICPNSTRSSFVSCTNITSDGRTCSIAFQTEVCSNLINNMSESVTVFLKAPDAPLVEAEQLFISSSSLFLIHTSLVNEQPMNIFGSIDGSATSYTVTYYDSTSHNVCRLAIIPVSPTFCSSSICRHVFDVAASPCYSSTSITIIAFATNVLGNGPRSSAVYVTLAAPEQIHPSTYGARGNTITVTDHDHDQGSGLLMTYLGSGALTITAVSSTVFIIVIIFLIRSKRKLKRELTDKQVGQSSQEMNTTTMEYEDVMDLHQNRELQSSTSTTIDIRDNAAYGRLSKLD